MPFSKNIIASDTIRYTTNIVDPFLQLEELKLMLVVTALTIGLYLLLQPRERSYLKKKLLALVAGRFFKTALQISTIFAVHLSFGEAVQDSSVTYEKVTACLKNRDGNNKNFDVKKLDHLKFPSDAEKHYQELLELTSQYRNHRPHSWAGFSGQ